MTMLGGFVFLPSSGGAVLRADGVVECLNLMVRPVG